MIKQNGLSHLINNESIHLFRHPPLWVFILTFTACLIASMSTSVNAATFSETQENNLSVSVGFSKKQSHELGLNEEQIAQKRQQKISITQERSAINNQTQVTGNETQSGSEEKSQLKASVKSRSYLPVAQHHNDLTYSFYSAQSFLLDDYDGDGYFQTFSVVFDADVYSYQTGVLVYAQVYADLYLSKNGGPWEYFYTTDNFIIEGENVDDEFEVITTLHQAYHSDSYDILIELYEADSDELVATISADDVNSLYALPLESTEYDVIIQDEVYISGGTASGFFIALLMLLLAVRYRLFSLNK